MQPVHNAQPVVVRHLFALHLLAVNHGGEIVKHDLVMPLCVLLPNQVHIFALEPLYLIHFTIAKL